MPKNNSLILDIINIINPPEYIYIYTIYFSLCYFLGTDSIFKDNNGGAHNTKNTDMSCLYQNHNVHTCHLSSSIFYGGQDIYPQTQSSQNASFNFLVSDNAFNNIFNLCIVYIFILLINNFTFKLLKIFEYNCL